MHLTLTSIKQSNKSIEKYKDRRVKCYNSRYNFWYGGIPGFPLFPVSIKSLGCILILEDVLKIFLLTGDSIDIYFEDILGEDKPNVKDYSQEDIYNCPTIKIDTNESRQTR